MKHVCIAILMLTALTGMVVAETDTAKAARRKKKRAEQAKLSGKTPEEKTDSKKAEPVVKKPYKQKPKPRPAKKPVTPPKPGPQSAADPYRSSQPLRANNAIDTILLAELKAKSIQPAKLCSDAVFVRRVFFDLAGTIPPPGEVRTFLASKDPQKRARLIGSLLNRKEANHYWTLKWCDHLRVKSEFPINLWPNAVAAYHQWVYQAITSNMPYDQFARALLTSSGSNFRVPAVNFYRAMQMRTPGGIADAAATTFLGTTLAKWPAAKQKQFALVFEKVKFKSTDEWKEQIVYCDPAPNTPGILIMPDGSRVTLTTFDDRRHLFANWLISSKNPWFARAAVNRLWMWMFDRPLVDDSTPSKSGLPRTNLKLMNYLTAEFVRSKYDQKHILRLIANSAIYQQSAIPSHKNTAKAKAAFACYPIRRHDAEVLLDAIDYIAVTHEKFMSIIPEPFTFIPIHNRTIALADGSITNRFLEMFGRPARDTGLLTERNNTPSIYQQLYLLNSTNLQTKLPKSTRILRVMRNYKLSIPQRVSELYLLILSRYPTAAESKIALTYLVKRRFGSSRSRESAFHDLAWALLNTNEFLYRH